MSEQLPLSAETPPTRPRYTLEQHDQTRQLWAIEWDRQTGDITGISGPLTSIPSPADLPLLAYSRNPLILTGTRRDMLDQHYTTWVPDEELA